MEMVKGPTYTNPSLRFDQAISATYKDPQTQVLYYLSYLLQITSLEYLMGRNNAQTRQILDLENSIFAGRQFWPKNIAHERNPESQPAVGFDKVPEHVIKKIVGRKEQRADLA